MNALKKYLMCEIFKINFLLIYNVQTKSYTWEEHPDEQTDHTSTLKATLDHTQFYFTRKRCVQKFYPYLSWNHYRSTWLTSAHRTSILEHRDHFAAFNSSSRFGEENQILKGILKINNFKLRGQALPKVTLNVQQLSQHWRPNHTDSSK